MVWVKNLKVSIKSIFDPRQTFRSSVRLAPLSFGSRSATPCSSIRILQLVDWTCLQRAIFVGTRRNWCPHLPEAINSWYDVFCSCTTILLPSEYNKQRWSRRRGGKLARCPQRLMGNYFRQIYACSHAELWMTVFDPHGQGRRQLFLLFPGYLGSMKIGGWAEEERAAGIVKRRLDD